MRYSFRATAGFTLLEILVAVAIGALVLTATYGLIANVTAVQERNEARSRQLEDMLFLRRRLQADMEYLIGNGAGAPPLSGKTAELVLRCSGEIVREMELGPEVLVRYAWEKQEGQLVLARSIFSPAGRSLPAYDFRLDQGLRQVSYELLDQSGWKDAVAALQPPVRALRLIVEWQEIGRWETVVRVKGQAPVSSEEEESGEASGDRVRQ